jgi:hypothetical protein
MLFAWFGLALHFQAAGRPALCLLFTLTYGCQVIAAARQPAVSRHAALLVGVGDG